MSFQNLINEFVAKLDQILDVGSQHEIAEAQIEDISQILIQFETCGIEKGKIKDFLNAITKYFAVLFQFLLPYGQSADHQVIVRNSLVVFMYIVNKFSIENSVVNKVAKLIDYIIEAQKDNPCCLKEFFRIYLLLLGRVDEDLKNKLAVKHKSIQYLYDIARNSGDSETQTFIVKIMFELFRFNEMKPFITMIFPAMGVISDFETRDKEIISQNVLTVLHKLQYKGTSITTDVNNSDVIVISDDEEQSTPPKRKKISTIFNNDDYDNILSEDLVTEENNYLSKSVKIMVEYMPSGTKKSTFYERDNNNLWEKSISPISWTESILGKRNGHMKISRKLSESAIFRLHESLQESEKEHSCSLQNITNNKKMSTMLEWDSNEETSELQDNENPKKMSAMLEMEPPEEIMSPDICEATEIFFNKSEISTPTIKKNNSIEPERQILSQPHLEIDNENNTSEKVTNWLKTLSTDIATAEAESEEILTNSVIPSDIATSDYNNLQSVSQQHINQINSERSSDIQNKIEEITKSNMKYAAILKGDYSNTTPTTDDIMQKLEELHADPKRSQEIHKEPSVVQEQSKKDQPLNLSTQESVKSSGSETFISPVISKPHVISKKTPVVDRLEDLAVNKQLYLQEYDNLGDSDSDNDICLAELAKKIQACKQHSAKLSNNEDFNKFEDASVKKKVVLPEFAKKNNIGMDNKMESSNQLNKASLNEIINLGSEQNTIQRKEEKKTLRRKLFDPNDLSYLDPVMDESRLNSTNVPPLILAKNATKPRRQTKPKTRKSKKKVIVKKNSRSCKKKEKMMPANLNSMFSKAQSTASRTMDEIYASFKDAIQDKYKNNSKRRYSKKNVQKDKLNDEEDNLMDFPLKRKFASSVPKGLKTEALHSTPILNQKSENKCFFNSRASTSHINIISNVLIPKINKNKIPCQSDSCPFAEDLIDVVNEFYLNFIKCLKFHNKKLLESNQFETVRENLKNN